MPELEIMPDRALGERTRLLGPAGDDEAPGPPLAIRAEPPELQVFSSTEHTDTAFGPIETLDTAQRPENDHQEVGSPDKGGPLAEPAPPLAGRPAVLSTRSWTTGLAMAFVSGLFFTAMNVMVKYYTVDALELLLVRSTLQSFVLTAIVALSFQANCGRTTTEFRRSDSVKAWAVIQGLMGSVRTYFNFACLLYIPIGDALTITFTEPLFTIVFALIFNRVRIGFVKVLLSLCLLGGLLLCVQPPFLFNNLQPQAPQAVAALAQGGAGVGFPAALMVNGTTSWNGNLTGATEGALTSAGSLQVTRDLVEFPGIPTIAGSGPTTTYGLEATPPGQRGTPESIATGPTTPASTAGDTVVVDGPPPPLYPISTTRDGAYFIGVGLSLGAALLGALTNIVVGTKCKGVSSSILVLIPGFLGVVVSLIGAAIERDLSQVDVDGQVPAATIFPGLDQLGPIDWLILFVISTLGILSYFTLMEALHIITPTSVSVLRAVEIVMAYAAQVLIFGQYPDLVSISGSLLVIASIVGIALEERRLAERQHGTTPA